VEEACAKHGLAWDGRVSVDAMSMEALRGDKEAAYNGYYRMLCYLFHKVVDCTSHLTLTWSVTPGDVDEGGLLAALLLKARRLKPKSMRQLKSIELEIGDNPSSNGRLHSNKSGDLAQVFVNGRLVAQYVLDLPTPYHEHIWRDGTHQPLDPQRQGSLLDITELSRQDNKVKIMVRVGPYTKWDISTVRLHIKTRKRELTKLAWTLIGFLLGLIPLVLVKSWP